MEEKTKLLEYKLINNGESYEIARGKDISGNLVIPSEYNGRPVTSIGEDAFRDCDGLKGVLFIPSSIVNIGHDAFRCCGGFDSIVVEKGNKKYYSDNNCLIEAKSKTLILGCNKSVIPDYIVNIDNWAFSNCNKLKGNLRISKNITRIGKGAFYGCSGLTGLTFEKDCKLEKIDEEAFYGLKSLKEVVIPSTIKEIASYSFAHCGLISVTIENENNLKSIGNGVFAMTPLEYFEVPESIENAGYNPFVHCKNLNSTEYGNCIYIGNSKNPYLLLIKSINKDIESCIIHKDTKIICDDAFKKCTALQSVVFEKESHLENIGESAFAFCPSLKKIEIPKSVKNISDWAFDSSMQLNCATIEKDSQLKSIGGFAFNYCSFESIVLPKSIEEVGSNAFNSGKKKIYFEAKILPVKIADKINKLGNCEIILGYKSNN